MSYDGQNRRASHRGSATVRRSHKRPASGGASANGVRKTSSYQQSSGNGSSYTRGAQSGRRTGDGRSPKGDGGNDIIKYIGIGAAALICIVLLVVFVPKLMGKSPAASAETEETLRAEAFSMDAAIDVREVLGIAETSETKASGEEGAETEAESLPNGVISVYGKTSDEIRSEIMALYSWDLKVVNDDASVGSVVTPTVDPNETTAPATMGDPENPDSLGDGAEDIQESKASSEITVQNEVEMPDLILQDLNSLLTELETAESEYRAQQEAEAAEESSEDEEESSDEASGTEIYKLSLTDVEAAAAETAELCATMWYKAPKGASIGSYDAENNKFVMEGAESGFEVDKDALEDSITAAIAAKDYEGRIEVVGNTLSADSATNLEAYKIIGTYQTKTTSNSVRNKNIRLACEALNGTIVEPGAELSFNDAVGQRTAEKGYGAAAAYNNGEVVQEIGGGVCQVSTTLYNAVLRAGLKTTKRQSHTFKPTYVTPGFDATISWGGPDYCFANVPANEEYSNSGSYAIGIFASYSNQTVTVSIYGRPVLKDGYSYELESVKIKDIDVVRKLIEPGSDQQPTTGSMGSQWQTYLIVKKDGEQIQRTLDHNTYYSGHIEYYTNETTTLAPTMPVESESAVEGETALSESETQIIEGPQGGPGVSGPGTSGTDGGAGGPGSVSGGPGSGGTTSSETTAPAVSLDMPTAPQETAASSGPGMISDAPVPIG